MGADYEGSYTGPVRVELRRQSKAASSILFQNLFLFLNMCIFCFFKGVPQNWTLL